MCEQTRSFTVVLLMLVFSSWLGSVCLAAPKQPIAQQAAKGPDKSQSGETKSPTAPEPAKAPDKITGGEAAPSTSQLAKTYAEIIKSEPLLIIIDKSKYKLHLFRDGKEIKNYDVAIGKNPGQKQCVGDRTTPTGEFKVDQIISSSYWTHDFDDGNGEIEGAYGPWFISLATGWDGIGIHGTHDPGSIGTMASEGCIRMNNDKVGELKELVSIGTKVVVAEA